MSNDEPTYARLARGTIGDEEATKALDVLSVIPQLKAETGDHVSRATFAMALNVILFAGLLRRVPSGAAYVDKYVRDAGSTTQFDHGALRTISFADGPTGELPQGVEAIARLLEPIGYQVAGVYPLPKLRMTGRAYAHVDHPASIPQFFLSELHVDQFDEQFQAAAHRVFGYSHDPVSRDTITTLARFADDKKIPFADALALMPEVVGAFGRHHGAVNLEDYEVLLSRSAEAGWIATEGNAFNHATDRVADVQALSVQLQTDGAPVKDQVEISANGRVRQTALRADSVERTFIADNGEEVRRMVPGSFYEYISRDIIPETDELDLTFDSGNATAIFDMTRAT